MTYDEMYIELAHEFPDVEIIPKEKSSLMRFINTFLMIVSFHQQQHFMVSYTTTIGQRIYVPYRWPGMKDHEKIAILRHERVHLRQQKKYGWFLFGFLYLFAFFPVVFSYYRMKFEKEAYAESIRAHAEYYGLKSILDGAYRRQIIRHFTTGSYLWMWPFEKSMLRWYHGVVEQVGAEVLARRKLRD